MSRRYASSDVSVDRYEDRRSEYRSNTGRRVYDDRYYEDDINYRRGPSHGGERDLRVREEVRVKERSVSRTRDRSPPDFLREDPRVAAGPVVLRKRETEDIEFVPRLRRRSPTPEPVVREREREEIIIRRDESERPPPRREREVEREEIIIRRDGSDHTHTPPRRERSRDREEIIIRKDESDRRPSRREPSREREEIIIRRDELERAPPRRERSRDREEIIIRRDESDRRPSRREPSREREEIIIRNDERDRSRRPPARESEREEIIIRRDEGSGRSRYDDDVISRRGDERYDRRGGDSSREEIIIRRDEERDDDTRSRYTGRYDDYALARRPKSHERERSRVGRASSHSSHDDEVIIRRDTREGRDGRDREREEIIIRKHSHSRSPSPESLRPAPEPPIIRAPPIHQEIITHHRHIDHGYEIARSREISRPPSPPSPPPPRAHSEERIEIKRSGERNGRRYNEDIVIKRDDNDDVRSVGPARSVRAEEEIAITSPRRNPYRDGDYDRDDREEAEYYNARALERSYPGEAYHGATRDWGLVDVPPGTRKVAMDGVGGGRQEITWQKYNGIRRSKFMPEGGSDEGYGSEVGRPLRPEVGGGEIGRRFEGRRNPNDGLWTEITKDLVVKEAITEAGYEFTETDECYYIIANLGYDDVARLVGLSEDIRESRYKRAKNIEYENRFMAPIPVVDAGVLEESRPRLAIEAAPPPPMSRDGRETWTREEEIYRERDVVYRPGRPPPPPAPWR